MTATTPVYANTTMAVEDRVADLLALMEVDEELAQLGAVGFPDLMKGERLDEEAALAVVPHGIGQVTRIGATTGLLPAQSAELLNEIQRVMVERTRLGVPVMVHEESVGGHCAPGATVFPQALALASSWDPGLVEEVAGGAAPVAGGGGASCFGAGAGLRAGPAVGGGSKRLTARTSCSLVRWAPRLCEAFRRESCPRA